MMHMCSLPFLFAITFLLSLLSTKSIQHSQALPNVILPKIPYFALCMNIWSSPKSASFDWAKNLIGHLILIKV
jgi:hypothetical protein